MSSNRDIHSDRETTKKLLSDPTYRIGLVDVEPNWLGHTDGSARIDHDLLEGKTMDGLLRHRGAVNNHIAHLNKDHGLLVKRDGKIMFDRTDLGLADYAPSPPDGSSSAELTRAATREMQEGHFSPTTLQDERERRLREIVQRRGQPEFRNKLIASFGGRCAVTGCDAVAALEAAHIVPYTVPQFNHVSNGLLLRADIHTLFDLDLIGIEPDSLTISVASAISTTVYAELDGKKFVLPVNVADFPNNEALVRRWKRFCGEKDGVG